MTPEAQRIKRSRLHLALWSLTFLSLGAILLGWKISVGVLLLMWGNNISNHIGQWKE